MSDPATPAGAPRLVAAERALARHLAESQGKPAAAGEAEYENGFETYQGVARTVGLHPVATPPVPPTLGRS